MVSLLLLLIGALLPVFYLLDRNVERFFLFDQNHLHDLSKRAIAEHGTDTKSIVKFIVAELHSMHPNHINLNEEWMFNNAGGCMGGMYIIHASMLLPLRAVFSASGCPSGG